MLSVIINSLLNTCVHVDVETRKFLSKAKLKLIYRIV